jgi:4-amino-4-deoxy-L-arabinose transferase-like glycosyltransferase
MSHSEDVASIAEPNGLSGEVADHVQKKRNILVKLLVYSGVLGVILIFLPENNRAADYLVGLPALILGIAWCYEDSRQHEFALGKLMRLGLIFIFALAFPIYIFRTRGLNGFKTLGQTLFFLAAMFACMFATGFVTMYLVPRP